MSTDRRSGRQRGLSLIELIVFIIIVSVGLAGVLSVFNVAVRGSADPAIRKNMLSLAESLLEEVMMQPYTYCDPDDANAATATSTASCTGGAGGVNDESLLREEAGEARGNLANPFDNVSDYAGAGAGVSLTPVTSVDGSHTYAGYSATISIAQASGGNALNGITDAMLITVVVTHGSDTLSLQGYRARYAPFSLP